jgi:hypothetical protein
MLSGHLFTGRANGYAEIGYHHFAVKENRTGVNIVGGQLNDVGILVGTDTGRYRLIR